MLLLAQRMWDDMKFSGEWNFGPSNQREITVKDLVDKFLKKWGGGSYTIAKDNEAREANYLQLDISKAKSVLSWFPKYNFEESIEKTVEWYKEYYRDRSSANTITENQIKTYFDGENDAMK